MVNWVNWGNSIGSIDHISPIDYDPNNPEAFFTAYFGPQSPAMSDSLAVLYFILNETSLRTGVTGVYF
jgi:hypothetical protein